MPVKRHVHTDRILKLIYTPAMTEKRDEGLEQNIELLKF